MESLTGLELEINLKVNDLVSGINNLQYLLQEAPRDFFGVRLAMELYHALYLGKQVSSEVKRVINSLTENLPIAQKFENGMEIFLEMLSQLSRTVITIGEHCPGRNPIDVLRLYEKTYLLLENIVYRVQTQEFL